MKENIGGDNEMREPGGGLVTFLFASSDFLLYARNRKFWVPAG
jgi:hypothetical protein